jgi:hypothetical protein
MKRGWKIAIWLAGGLVLSAGAQADIVASAGNPYGPIVTRNIFGLNPVQATETATDPPPKITLNGLMSIYGKVQVLFKVAGTGKPGQPAKDQSYILSEGQRQDDIEVTHIDDQANLVTFNNHGTVQEVPLASAPVVTGPGPVGPAGLGGQVPRARFGRQMGVPGGMGGQNRGMGNNANPNPNQNQIQNQNPIQNPVMTEEQAAAAIINTEAQRTQWENQGNPAAMIIPRTMLTHGGAPQAP